MGSYSFIDSLKEKKNGLEVLVNGGYYIREKNMGGVEGERVCER